MLGGGEVSTDHLDFSLDDLFVDFSRKFERRQPFENHWLSGNRWPTKYLIGQMLPLLDEHRNIQAVRPEKTPTTSPGLWQIQFEFALGDIGRASFYKCVQHVFPEGRRLKKYLDPGFRGGPGV
jgi:hypothetical protein